MADKTIYIQTKCGTYGIVHTVTYRSDNDITIVDMKKTWNAIKKEDPDFAAFMAIKWFKANGTTFSYGDKYFVPLAEENTMLCIPLSIRDWGKKILENDPSNTEFAKIIREDELKLRKKMEKSGYFDVSDFVIH